MSEVVFSLLTPFLFLLLGMGQWGLWSMWRSRPELAWMGLSFVAVSAAMVVQWLTSYWPLVWNVLSFTVLYLVCTTAAGQALALRLRVQMPWRLATAIVLCVLLAQTWYSLVDPSLQRRVLLLTCLALLIMALPLLYWRRMQPRNVYDHLLRWLYLCCVLSNIARTLLHMPQDPLVRPETFMQSGFWAVLHMFAMGTGMALAGCLFFAVLRDVLQELQSERNTDVLTQLLNRRGWQMRLEQLRAEHAKQPMAPCALLLADIDHFKHINDGVGHAVGDVVLQHVARVLQQRVGEHGLACRYGGEEFVLLLRNTDLAAAQQVAERIRQQVQQLRIAQLDALPLTISVGLAPLAGCSPAQVSEALHMADQQLYAAKAAGRNQVAVSLAPMPSYS